MNLNKTFCSSILAAKFKDVLNHKKSKKKILLLSFSFCLSLDPLASIVLRAWFCFLRKRISDVRELCSSEP